VKHRGIPRSGIPDKPHQPFLKNFSENIFLSVPVFLSLVSKPTGMKITFKKTQKFLQDVPNINFGGCGMAALALYDAAKKEGKKPKIVYVYSPWDEDSYRKNIKFKEGKSKKADACMHIVIKIGKNYYDADGKISKGYVENYFKDPEITRDHLVASINNKGVWNDSFRRKIWGPEIKKFFKKGTKINF
jgi:hypothetical protein